MRYALKLFTIFCVVGYCLVVFDRPVHAQAGGFHICGKITYAEMPFTYIFVPYEMYSDPRYWWVLDESIWTGSGEQFIPSELEGRYVRIFMYDVDQTGGELWGEPAPLLRNMADFDVVDNCAPEIKFWVESGTITQGECTIIHWQVIDAREVFLDGQSVYADDMQVICPTVTTVYRLTASPDYGRSASTVTVAVVSPTSTATPTRVPPTATPTRVPPMAAPARPANTPRPLPTVAAPTPDSGIQFGCAGFGQCAQPSPTPIPSELGAKVSALVNTRLRVQPADDAAPLELLLAGTQMYVVGGPVAVSDRTWWKVMTIPTGNQKSMTGWCEGDSLTLIGGQYGKPKLQVKFAVRPLASTTVTVFKPNEVLLTVSNEGTAPFVLPNPGEYRIDIMLREGSRILEKRSVLSVDDPLLPRIAVILPGEDVQIRLSNPSFYFLHSASRGMLTVEFITDVQSVALKADAKSTGRITIQQHEDNFQACFADLLKGASTIFPATAPLALPAAYALKLEQCDNDWKCGAKESFWFLAETLSLLPEASEQFKVTVAVTSLLNDFEEFRSSTKPSCLIAADAFGAYGMTWIREFGHTEVTVD